jgi:hypothetical protein
MKNKILYLLALLLLGLSQAYPQKRAKEIGVVMGISQYYGDLAPNEFWDPQSFAGGGLFRYYLNPIIDIRASATYGQVSGSDAAKPKLSKYAVSRNLSFKSRIIDVSAMLELNLKQFISGKNKKSWAPYITAGVAVFNFDPKALYEGKWYRLQPLGTEGQGTRYGTPKYNLTAISIPWGVGIKYGFKRPKYFGSALNLELWNIGFEIISHKTWTDHLDDVGGFYPSSLDVFNGNQIAMALCDRSGEIGYKSRIYPDSKRGNPDKMDGYLWYTITITKTFRPSRCFHF